MTERQKRIDETARACFVMLVAKGGPRTDAMAAREAWELAAILEDARPAEATDVELER